MTLIRSNAFFPQFFDDFFTRDLSNWRYPNNYSKATTMPSVNIVESPENFMVEMAVPGMRKEDFQVELNDDILRIWSEKSDENAVEQDNAFLRKEFSYRAFERTFTLPKSVVDQSKIEAKYQDGILRLMIPKREEAKALPPRKIAIK
ncbi:MAG: Hsp20/alpha crystallin family protein [Saprospiraceae bacterium]|nr:Hsp20/alpha crystallin family protein [Saprospiraceae bacterium]